MCKSDKLCDECKHFELITDAHRLLFDYPICKHPKGWVGVYDESIGMPLGIGKARQDTASCGSDGNNWEEIEA